MGIFDLENKRVAIGVLESLQRNLRIIKGFRVEREK